MNIANLAYPSVPGHYDELMAPDGSVRKHWRPLIDVLERLTRTASIIDLLGITIYVFWLLRIRVDRIVISFTTPYSSATATQLPTAKDGRQLISDAHNNKNNTCARALVCSGLHQPCRSGAERIRNLGRSIYRNAYTDRHDRIHFAFDSGDAIFPHCLAKISV